MLVLALMVVLPSHAVLKEKNIENTLSLLRLELTNYRTELERQSGLMKAQQEQVMMNMISVMNRSRQNSLMLYSQKNGFIFDLTYACHEAARSRPYPLRRGAPMPCAARRTETGARRPAGAFRRIGGLGARDTRLAHAAAAAARTARRGEVRRRLLRRRARAAGERDAAAGRLAQGSRSDVAR